jgi:SAM-dependent methyltransferase
MSTPARFVGAIPENYDRLMGPVFFEPYAIELASRVPAGSRRILEIAAGTGRVTRQVLARLPADGSILATDLNEGMIAVGEAQFTGEPRVTWQVADAMSLPVEDGAFDCVLCQFGLMFVPDKAQAMREMRRALRPGGTLLVATWDAIERNHASAINDRVAVKFMPGAEPFFRTIPFSMHDPALLDSLAEGAGFSRHSVETVSINVEAPSASFIAEAFTRGTPLWIQLTEHGVDIDAYARELTAALGAELGGVPTKCPMSAHILTAVS